MGIGIASNISPVYIAEVSPAKVRGRFVSLNQLTIVMGILLAQLANWMIGNAYAGEGGMVNAGSTEWGWRWMFWAELVPALLFFALSFVIPESPRWLLSVGRGAEARRILTRIGGEAYAAGTLGEQVSPQSPAGFHVRSLLGKELRGVLVIGVVLAVFQQWCGINVIFNYAHEIFSAAGYEVSDVLMNIVVTGCTNVVFTFVAIHTVDRWGRRTLMLFGSAALALIYFFMGCGYWWGVGGWPMLCLVVLAEIFPVRVRAAAVALSTFGLWTACFVLTYTFPWLNEQLGASGTFWLYGGICLAGFLFIRKRLPETKGKTLEEIENELTGKH